MAAYPGVMERSTYFKVVNEEVWELKHAYRETCLCRSCFNYRCYKETLKVVHKILLLLLEKLEQESVPDESDATHANGNGDEADGAMAVVVEQDTPPPASTMALKALVDFCSRSEVGSRKRVAELICANEMDAAIAPCILGECARCGFGAIWSRGLRPHLVDPSGQIRLGVSSVWTQEINWSRIKSGGDGSNSEDDLRQTCNGSIIKFLDQFESVQKYHVRHGFHIDQSKRAEGDFRRNAIPGMVDDKSDWSENGSLAKKRQIQSEYWVIVYYSLLISISSFLVSSAWRERACILPVDTEVTVEPLEYVPPDDGSIEAAPGSYWGRVKQLTIGDGGGEAYTVGEDVEYAVEAYDGSIARVRRSQLRWRKWHRIAFVQLTNDKKHDLYSTSAFASRRLQFFQRWHNYGRGSAVEWAKEDMAELERRRAIEVADVEGASTTATTALDAST